MKTFIITFIFLSISAFSLSQENEVNLNGNPVTGFEWSNNKTSLSIPAPAIVNKPSFTTQRKVATNTHKDTFIYDVKVNKLRISTIFESNKYRYFIIKPRVTIYKDSLVFTEGKNRQVYKFKKQISDGTISEYVASNDNGEDFNKLTYTRSMLKNGKKSKTFINICIDNRKKCYFFSGDITNL